MADAPLYLTRLWHDRALYVCPQCGTSRTTIAFIQRHMHVQGHAAPLDDSPAPQAEGRSVVVDAPAPAPEEIRL